MGTTTGKECVGQGKQRIAEWGEEYGEGNIIRL